MADRKVSELPTLTTAAGVDRLYIVDDPNGTPVSKQISLDNLLGTIPANTTFAQTATFNNKVTVANGFVTLSTSKTVSSNNAETVLGTGAQGSIFWDTNYLYVAVSNTQIKRVALSVFSP
jgi:hypothetical protein